MFPATRTEIAGVSLREIARRFGTPTYVYDAAVIERMIDDFKMFYFLQFSQNA